MLSSQTINIVKLAIVSALAFIVAMYRDSAILSGKEYVEFLQYYITLNMVASILCEYLQNNYFKTAKYSIFLLLVSCLLLVVLSWYSDIVYLNYVNLIIVACAQSLVVGSYVVNGRYYLMNLSIVFENLCIIFLISTHVPNVFEIVILYRIIFTFYHLAKMPDVDVQQDRSFILFLVNCLCTMSYALLMFFLFDEETSEDVLLYRYLHYLFAVGLVPLNIIVDKLTTMKLRPRMSYIISCSILLLGLFLLQLIEMQFYLFTLYLLVYYTILTMIRIKSRI
jgi:hypothetical protein